MMPARCGFMLPTLHSVAAGTLKRSQTYGAFNSWGGYAKNPMGFLVAATWSGRSPTQMRSRSSLAARPSARFNASPRVLGGKFFSTDAGFFSEFLSAGAGFFGSRFGAGVGFFGCDLGFVAQFNGLVLD